MSQAAKLFLNRRLGNDGSRMTYSLFFFVLSRIVGCVASNAPLPNINTS